MALTPVSPGAMMRPLTKNQQRIVDYFQAHSTHDDQAPVRQQLFPNIFVAPSRPGKTSILDRFPNEVRREIFSYVVTRRYDNKAGERNGEKRGIVIRDQPSRYRTKFPALLYTSKNNLLLAAELIYSQNKFYCHSPARFTQFLQDIGPINTQNVTSLHFWIPEADDPQVWIRFFELLSTQTTGLKKVALYYHLGNSSLHGNNFSLGGNIDLIRAFTRIRGLHTVELSGYYASKWPEFVKKQMNVRVAQTSLELDRELFPLRPLLPLKAYQADKHHIDPSFPALNASDSEQNTEA